MKSNSNLRASAEADPMPPKKADAVPAAEGAAANESDKTDYEGRRVPSFGIVGIQARRKRRRGEMESGDLMHD